MPYIKVKGTKRGRIKTLRALLTHKHTALYLDIYGCLYMHKSTHKNYRECGDKSWPVLAQLVHIFSILGSFSPHGSYIAQLSQTSCSHNLTAWSNRSVCIQEKNFCELKYYLIYNREASRSSGQRSDLCCHSGLFIQLSDLRQPEWKLRPP